MSLLSLLMAAELIFGLLAINGPFFGPFTQAQDAAPAPAPAPIDTTPAPPVETPPEVSPETPPDTTTPEQATPQEPPAPEESAPPPQEETQTPAESTTPQQESSQLPTEQTPTPNEVAPTQEIIGDENTQESAPPSSDLLNETPQGETPSEEQTPPATETNPIPVPEFTPEETTAINESSSVVSTQINDQIIQKAQQEDDQLAQATTPQETAALTLQFADEKVSDIETSIQSDDFASTDFLIQRVTNQLDQTLTGIGTLSEDNTGLTQDLKDFSQKADAAFRSAELVVPENLEQDFEIARGIFLNIQQVK